MSKFMGGGGGGGGGGVVIKSKGDSLGWCS